METYSRVCIFSSLNILNNFVLLAKEIFRVVDIVNRKGIYAERFSAYNLNR